MLSEKRHLFGLLKEELAGKAATSLGIRKNLADWSVNDIRDFQEDLMQQCKGSVSEKWVYQHLKKEQDNLPRIDVLNLLSCYCGYRNWDDFTFQHGPQGESKMPKKRVVWLIPIVVAGLIVLVSLYFRKEETIALKFVDAYTLEGIPAHELNFNLSSGKRITDKRLNEMLTVKKYTKDTLIADGRYYKATSLYLGDEAGDTLYTKMYPDDYALMLVYFSKSSTEDWERRRSQLEEVIHDNARIFQVYELLEGIELLNKEEFINRLVLPIQTLRGLEVIDVEYLDGQIYRLRFTIKNDKNED